jgi:hypothetical protein
MYHFLGSYVNRRDSEITTLSTQWAVLGTTGNQEQLLLLIEPQMHGHCKYCNKFFKKFQKTFVYHSTPQHSWGMQ